ncbi:Conserved_hypothetical protein [Hexamita inflata]|uniref:Uncharacterized protein n=1 Tax=Hexamita inflata TaxID=28002 RepID=A0AA86NHS9_9EUKA|nr:Conserved hypothetical protein [Hexamita inflata]
MSTAQPFYASPAHCFGAALLKTRLVNKALPPGRCGARCTSRIQCLLRWELRSRQLLSLPNIQLAGSQQLRNLLNVHGVTVLCVSSALFRGGAIENQIGKQSATAKAVVAHVARHAFSACCVGNQGLASCCRFPTFSQRSSQQLRNLLNVHGVTVLCVSSALFRGGAIENQIGKQSATAKAVVAHVARHAFSACCVGNQGLASCCRFPTFSQRSSQQLRNLLNVHGVTVLCVSSALFRGGAIENQIGKQSATAKAVVAHVARHAFSACCVGNQGLASCCRFPTFSQRSSQQLRNLLNVHGVTVLCVSSALFRGGAIENQIGKQSATAKAVVAHVARHAFSACCVGNQGLASCCRFPTFSQRSSQQLRNLLNVHGVTVLCVSSALFRGGAIENQIGKQSATAKAVVAHVARHAFSACCVGNQGLASCCRFPTFSQRSSQQLRNLLNVHGVTVLCVSSALFRGGAIENQIGKQSATAKAVVAHVARHAFSACCVGNQGLASCCRFPTFSQRSSQQLRNLLNVHGVTVLCVSSALFRGGAIENQIGKQSATAKAVVAHVARHAFSACCVGNQGLASCCRFPTFSQRSSQQLRNLLNVHGVTVLCVSSALFRGGAIENQIGKQSATAKAVVAHVARHAFSACCVGNQGLASCCRFPTFSQRSSQQLRNLLNVHGVTVLCVSSALFRGGAIENQIGKQSATAKAVVAHVARHAFSACCVGNQGLASCCRFPTFSQRSSQQLRNLLNVHGVTVLCVSSALFRGGAIENQIGKQSATAKAVVAHVARHAFSACCVGNQGLASCCRFPTFSQRSSQQLRNLLNVHGVTVLCVSSALFRGGAIENQIGKQSATAKAVVAHVARHAFSACCVGNLSIVARSLIPAQCATIIYKCITNIFIT